jgi:hypothetical protein
MLENLDQFCGTTEYYRWSSLFPRAVLTDGTHYVAEKAGAYWLMDAIASHQPAIKRHPDARLRDIQFWRLRVSEDKSAVLTCVADDGCKPAVEQAIEFTDFPLPEIRLYVTLDEEQIVIMLPSEY